MTGFQFLARFHLTLAHIGPRGKRPTVAAQHRHIRLVIQIEAVQRVRKRRDHGIAERIQPFGAVEADDRDLTFATILDTCGPNLHST